MKKFLFNLFVFCTVLPLFSQAESLRAFPGAEGFGAYVTGGRGGRVVYVTNLNDVLSGPKYQGSLRQALETPGNDPITVVFRCGGVIRLESAINCRRSNVTIAGQTAMGDGICLAQYGIIFNGVNNIIVRYLRSRVGDEINQNCPALTFSNGKGMIIDHCSFSWSVEENVNITDVDSVSLQWCINSESLYNSVHTKGARAYAAQWGGQTASYHHNLLAHHNSRMPRQNGNTSSDYQLTWDYRNNVHYNWGGTGAFYGGGVEQAGGWSHSNLVNNYYVPGPATNKATNNDKNKEYFCAPSGGRPAVTGDGILMFKYGAGKWWLNGNVMKNNTAKTSNNFSGLNPGEATGAGLAADTFNAKGAFPIVAAYSVTTTSADTAYKYVLLNAGATLPKRDSIDRRIVMETKTQTAVFGGTTAANSKGLGFGIIDSHKDTKPASVASYLFNAWDSYYVGITPLVDTTTDAKTKFKREQVIIYKTVLGSTTRTVLLSDTVYFNNRLDSDGDGIPDGWEDANGLDKCNANDGNKKDASGYTMLEVYLNSINGTEDKMSNMPTSIFANRTSNMPYLNVYPNPSSMYFNIETVLEPQLVEVYSITGLKVATFVANGQRTFSVVPLIRGNYIVKVTFTNGTFATKQMIKK